MLFQRHDVGHDLAGMRLVGEAVDHRNGRVIRQFAEVVMRLGADHDGIDIARQNPRRIGNGFAAAQVACRLPKAAGFRRPAGAWRPRRRRACGSTAARKSSRESSRRAAGRARLRLAPGRRGHPSSRGSHRGCAAASPRRNRKDREMMRRAAHGRSLSRAFASRRGRPGQARSTASAISSSVTISGGRRRMTLSPAPMVSSFSPSAAARTPYWEPCT